MRLERRRLAFAAVAGFQLLLSLSFYGKPLDIDEPVYVAMARHARKEPLSPGSLRWFWEGRTDTVSRIVPSPPLPSYLYAGALALAGDDETRLRLVLIPVDVLAALLLLLLAGRFLKEPLLPVLAVLAGPGWWLTIPALLLEKWMALFGLAALYAASRAKPGKPDGWWWAAAGLAALACLAKYSGIVFPLACAAFLLARGATAPRVAAWLAAALAPAGAYLLSGFFDPERLRSFALHASPAGGTGLAHQARAALAFAPGCAPALAVWAWASGAPPKRLALGALAAAALFMPAFDLLPAVPADRILGLALGACAGAALAAAASGRQSGGAPLWLGLGLSALLLETLAYWSVAGRFSLFVSAGLALALAERVERARGLAAARRLAWAALLLTLPLGAAAAAADAAHAKASRWAASAFAAAQARAGMRVWFTGHWGLQHYMQAAGARPLNPDAGGWARLGPGDRVVVPGVNTNVRRPQRPVASSVHAFEAPAPLPLLLMCGARWSCQAGFHSSQYGFLPFALSPEPIDRFEIVDLR